MRKKKKPLGAREKAAIVLLAALYVALCGFGISRNGELMTRQDFAPSHTASPTEQPVFNAPLSAMTDAPTHAPSVTVHGKLDINQADQWVLEAIPGIGSAIAQRIVDYRASHDGFRAMEELRRIQGIGDKLYSVLIEYLEIPSP